ncbi:MAG TPA: chloride channel protein [Burkholderiaceae bacterium]|nr:chloride channel protein [Burkholderiaceae bacterium]
MADRSLPKKRLRVALRTARSEFRLYLARSDALLGLSLLGVVAGLLTGSVIVAFRLLTEAVPVWAGLMPHPERFEALDWRWRLGLPTVGGLVIGLLFQAVSVGARQVGPVHVMVQLASGSARMPWRNAALQFFGGGLSIVSGHSVGREGPVIHVGAASASLLGRWMRLPNNSFRTLVACGVAGAIAASFNTPIAGVVFAMEVVLLEYTLLGFAPVILAAFASTSLSRLVYGDDPAFAVPGFQLVSQFELPWIVLLGVSIGCMAAAYVHGVRRIDERFRHWPLWLRTTAAGLFCGLCGLIAPEIMGLGYDTVQLALIGSIGLSTLLLIAVLKLLATIACSGLGLPGGSIGPMVVMGATAGGAIGIIGHDLMPGASAEPGFYAALGMVAMMGASLQAPLSALMAILELTGNANTIMPGMVAVITALLVARVVFRQDPMFVAILRSRGLDFRFDPVAQALERTGVAAVMSRSFVALEAGADDEAVARALAGAPDWLLVVEGRAVRGVLSPRQMVAAPAAERHTEQHADRHVQDTRHARTGAAPGPPAVALPHRMPPFVIVDSHATLREALAQLDASRVDVAIVSRGASAERSQVYGMISRAQIESGTYHRY